MMWWILVACTGRDIERPQCLGPCRDAPLEGVVDADCDCLSPAQGDCDDGDHERYEGAPEVCDDVDNDCDGVVDNAPAEGGIAYYADRDGDGFGVAEEVAPTLSCPGRGPSGFVTEAGDCAPTDPERFPGADEVCDEVDNDCDGDVDDADADVMGDTVAYVDGDGDGYGKPGQDRLVCEITEGLADNPDDCDDATPSVSPAGTETVVNGVDDDCDGRTDDVEVSGVATQAVPWEAAPTNSASRP